ncbi:MAG: hypothetical protein JO129_01650 [Candidatus Dependentiae bacterium]|nr:hypothetical protein [Candidatus Dependentiae bacterium]
MKQLQNKILIIFLITSTQILHAMKGLERNSVENSPLGYASSLKTPTKVEMAAQQTAAHTSSTPSSINSEETSSIEKTTPGTIFANKPQPSLSDLTQNTSSEKLSGYDPLYKNEFMTIRAEFYLKALKEKFPNASEADLENYTTMFLNENYGKYNQKITPGLFWNTNVDDPNNPITVKPGKITNKPTKSGSELGKLFTSMEQKEEQVHKQSLESASVPGLIITEASLSNQNLQRSQSIEAAIQSAAKKLNTALVTNSDLNKLLVDLKNKMTESKTLNDSTTIRINYYVETASEQILALKESGKPVTQADYEAIMNKMTESILEEVDPTLFGVFDTLFQFGMNLVGQASSSTVSAISNIASNQYNKAAEPFIKEIEDLVDAWNQKKAKEETASPIKTETKNEPNAVPGTIYTNESKTASEPSPETEPAIATSDITSYFSNSFKSAAQAIRNSPQALKNFINNVTSTISLVCGLSKGDAAKLQAQGEKEINAIIADKSSWFYADDSQFNNKFYAWIISFIAKLYTLVGKGDPRYTKIIQLEAQSKNPLTPQITLNYNKNSSELDSILVSYNGNSYSIKPPFDLINNVYIIKDIPLLNKPKALSAKGAVYNYTAEELIINPLMEQTAAGQALGPQVHEQVKGAFLIPKGQTSDGVMTIKFDKATNKVTTQIEKNINQSKVVTTKEYDLTNSTKGKETISIASPQSADIYAPAIDIVSNPSGGIKNLLGNLESVKITHTDPISKKSFSFDATSKDIKFDQKTGIYIIDCIVPNDKAVEEPQSILGLSPELSKRLKALVPKITAIAYESGIENLENLYIPATLKNLNPVMYKFVKAFLLEAIPTQIERVTVQYNPATNVITTDTIKRMSDNKTDSTQRIYEIS